MPGLGIGGSADFGGGFLDGLVDVLRAHVEFLGDVLVGLQPGRLHGLLQLALPDDDQRGRPSSMMSPNSLTSAPDMPRHKWPPTPPAAAPTVAAAMIAGGNKMPTRALTAAPPHAPCTGGHRILADVHLARGVLGDHGGVVGADGTGGMEVLTMP